MNLIPLSTVIALSIMPLPALSQNALQEQYKYCDGLSSLAASIMKARQSGSPKNIASLLVNDLGSDARQLVKWAYGTSIRSTQEQREFQIKQFSAETKMGCKKSAFIKISKNKPPAASNKNITLPQELAVMIGQWESTHYNNRYRMKIVWDEGSQELHGYLTKNGALSRAVGFSINEHIFTAKLLLKPRKIIAIHKYRSGKNGKSNWSKWLSSTITGLEQGSKREMISSSPPLWDGNISKSKFKKIN